jgi:hypothetical protein
MTDKAMGPGAGDAGGPSEKATRSRSDLSGNHLRIKEPTEFWLHVRADGSELRFAHEPTDVRSLRVETIEIAPGKWVEETRTYTVENEGLVHEIIMVKPRGAGWKLHDESSDNWTVWRRSSGRKVVPVKKKPSAG